MGKCSFCGNDVKSSSAIRIGDEVFCDAICAIMAGYVICHDCGKWVLEEDAVRAVDGMFFCCEEHAEKAGFVKCCQCETWVNADDAITIDDAYYCDSGCAEEAGYVRCEECEDWVREDDAVELESGSWLCNSCWDEYGFECSDCGGRFNRNDMECYEDEDVAVCGYCYDRHEWGTCEDCGHLSRHLHYCDSDDNYYCDDCWDAYRTDYIRGYHDSPELLFNCTDEDSDPSKVYFGVELETDNGSKIGECSKELYELSCHETKFHQEHDGSLSRGIEIISQPFDWEHVDSVGFDKICETSKRYGFRSHETSTCGLHIHFSRQPFYDATGTDDLMAAKLVYYFEKYQSTIERVARRSSEKWSSFKKVSDGSACRIDTAIALKNIKEIKGWRDRYQAVNLTNEDTIEIRVFKGTLNYNTLMATIEFVKRVVDYVNSSSIEDIQCGSFEDSMVDMSDNLKDYLIRRGVIKSDSGSIVVEDISEEGDGVVCA